MKKYKQIWASPTFARRLNEIKAKIMLKTGREESIADITERMLNSNSFKDMECEIVEPRIQRMRYDK